MMVMYSLDRIVCCYCKSLLILCFFLQFGPSLLPHELMLRLASDVVATTTGRVQQHAATVILETARCCCSSSSNAGNYSNLATTTTSDGGGSGVPVFAGSGGGREPSCGLAEVNVLLDGLQSSSVALREVSIQASTISHTAHCAPPLSGG